MLKELKFVQGAVSKKKLLPELTHFSIKNGYIKSFNGALALCSPINVDINCIPKAIPFVKAIQNCKEVVSLHMTPTERLAIKSGKFKAFIDCMDLSKDASHAEPEGDTFAINGEELLLALKTLQPFIGNDASRPWSNGVLFKNQSAYATNNVCLMEYWVGSTFPLLCTIPSDAIREMVRINEPPISAQSTDTSISFHYEDGKWIRCQLLSTEWPDLQKILNQTTTPVPIEIELFDALETLKPFTDKAGRVYFKNGIIKTSLVPNEGASYEIDNFNHEGVYQLELLLKLKTVIMTIDLSTYPKPCLFYGDNLRGAIIGMRK